MTSRITPRNLGLWMGQLPSGQNNDITDVPGVLVGHVSLLWGSGELIPGRGPVRTGVTAVLPHGGNLYRDPCWAGIFVLNGYGKSIGVPFIKETGILNTPILLTNTLSVNDVARGVLTYLLRQNPEIGDDARTPNLAVFECDDSYLNDIRGRHVKPSDAILAIQRSRSGPMLQGNVGAGVGMSCFELKGGIGSSSRIVQSGTKMYTLGVIALANFGILEDLLINGIPVGSILKIRKEGYVPGSLILIGITDAPLSRWQLMRLAQRAALGQARTGSISMTGSGDFCLVVSNHLINNKEESISDWEMDVFYRAMVEATAESIWNALFLAYSLDGRDNHYREALPIEQTLEIMKTWNR